jgi:hypothetical protein
MDRSKHGRRPLRRMFAGELDGAPRRVGSGRTVAQAVGHGEGRASIRRR